MEKELLERLIGEGLSQSEIGRRVGRHPSTVAYWTSKHGLEAVGAGRHGARGAIPKSVLAELVGQRLSIRTIAEQLDRSPATVRYWLKRHGLRLARSRGAPRGIDPSVDRVAGDCPTHGEVDFIRRADGWWRCVECRVEAVSARRRRVKELLVAEAGGACRLCGYARSMAALQFHHLDPSTKSFDLGRVGATRSLERARAEAAKCALLCANCHAEVEAGVAILR